MKALLSLTTLCLALAFSHGFCLYRSLKVRFKNGQLVKPDGCTDPYDKSIHPFGSMWNTTLCLRCHCEEFQLRCCTRYDDVGSTLECTPLINSETCELKMYRKDDPTKPCF